MYCIKFYIVLYSVRKMVNNVVISISGINNVTIIINHTDTSILESCFPHSCFRPTIIKIHQIRYRKETFFKNLFKSLGGVKVGNVFF